MNKRHIVDMPSEPFTKKYGGLNKAENEKMRVIFYPGCAVTLIYTHWGEAIVETLLHYGVSVYVPKTNKCCGIPAATMGEMGLYRQQANDNFDYFDGIDDADYIITCCRPANTALPTMPSAKQDAHSVRKRSISLSS